MSAPNEGVEDLPIEDGHDIKGGSLEPEELKNLRREAAELRADPVGHVSDKAGELPGPT